MARDLGEQIEKQKALATAQLAKNGFVDAETYYWGAPESRPKAWGNAGVDAEGGNILPQLLLTPKLFVDVLPLPADRFIKVYGIDPVQMLQLADEEFVFPNIYHHYDGGWRDYESDSDVYRLLTQHGRLNGAFVKAYLNARFDFERRLPDYVSTFAQINLSDSDWHEVAAHSDGRLKTRESAARVFGQRLAYIDLLGNEQVRTLVPFVRDAYRLRGSRLRAISILNAAKNIVASPTTGSFGGEVFYSRQDIADEEALSADSVTIFGGHSSGNGGRLPTAALTYAKQIAERAAGVPIFQERRPYRRRGLPTDNDEFKALLKVLRDVRDGQLGRLIRGMVTALTQTDASLADMVDEYTELERRVDEKLRPFRSLSDWLYGFGSLASKAYEMHPDAGTELTIMGRAGVAVQVLAAYLHDKEFALKTAPYSRHLVNDYKVVKRALRLERPQGRSRS